MPQAYAAAVPDAVPPVINPDLEAVSFFDADHGCAVGRNGAVVLTSDGGNNWRMVPGPNDRPDLFAVRFESPTTGVAVGPLGLFFRTTDGGARWNFVPEVKGDLRTGLESAVLVSQTEAWGLGLDRALYRTTDAGRTWSKTDAVPGARGPSFR